MCPASGHAPTGRCELKPGSTAPQTRGKTRIPVTDELRAHPPQVCAQQTVTFPPQAGAKLHQTLPYASDEWATMYATLRNSIEGMNGIAKNGAYAALGDANRRRIRGVAALTILTALLLMATNSNRILSFLRKAVPDLAGTLRTPRKPRRTTRPLSGYRPDVDASAGAPPP